MPEIKCFACIVARRNRKRYGFPEVWKKFRFAGQKSCLQQENICAILTLESKMRGVKCTDNLSEKDKWTGRRTGIKIPDGCRVVRR